MCNSAIPDLALKKAIQEIVDQHWRAYGLALLLSELGKSLGAQQTRYRETLGGQKLAVFIASHLSDEIQIFRLCLKKASVWVAPKCAKLSADASASFKPVGHRPQFNLPRFDNSVWLAFRRPVKPHYIRYIRLEPAVKFRDVPACSSAEDDEFIITESDISAKDDVAQIGAHILNWAHTHGINVERLKKPRSAPTLKPTIANTEESVFSLMVTALSDAELAKLSLPLDIVVKLLKARV